MKKYYLNGTEVEVSPKTKADIKVMIEENGKKLNYKFDNWSEETLDTLAKLGIVEEKDIKETPDNVLFYIQKLQNKLKLNYDEFCSVLSCLEVYYPASLFTMLLKMVAVELDKKYPDHISNSKEIYVFDLLNLKIVKLNREAVPSFKNISAFRTREDIKFACKVLYPLIKELAENDSKQKNS